MCFPNDTVRKSMAAKNKLAMLEVLSSDSYLMSKKKGEIICLDC